MVILNTLFSLCLTAHQIIQGHFVFLDQPPKELPTWLDPSSLMPPVELLFTMVEIVASILALLDVNLEISCSSSALRSLPLPLGFPLRASHICFQFSLTYSLFQFCREKYQCKISRLHHVHQLKGIRCCHHCRVFQLLRPF